MRKEKWVETEGVNFARRQKESLSLGRRRGRRKEATG